jgi:hypothetical protein
MLDAVLRAVGTDDPEPEVAWAAGGFLLGYFYSTDMEKAARGAELMEEFLMKPGQDPILREMAQRGIEGFKERRQESNQ